MQANVIYLPDTNFEEKLQTIHKKLRKYVTVVVPSEDKLKLGITGLTFYDERFANFQVVGGSGLHAFKLLLPAKFIVPLDVYIHIDSNYSFYHVTRRIDDYKVFCKTSTDSVIDEITSEIVSSDTKKKRKKKDVFDGVVYNNDTPPNASHILYNGITLHISVDMDELRKVFTSMVVADPILTIHFIPTVTAKKVDGIVMIVSRQLFDKFYDIAPDLL